MQVDWTKCTQCGECTRVCYPGALKMSGEWISAAEVLAQIEKEQPFFAASCGGVTLSGGEATAQADFATAFLRGCRALGIHTALETNGCAHWQIYQELMSVVDLFLYDLKLMDDVRHRELTGASNQLALRNLGRLVTSGSRVIVRVPCIPGLNDDEANIRATAAFASQAGVEEMHLLPYNSSAGAKYDWLGRDYEWNGLERQTAEKMEALAAICQAQGLKVQVEG